MSEPTPPPAGIADFRIVFPVQKAKAESIATGFVSHSHATRIAGDWSLEVPPVVGSSFETIDTAYDSGALAMTVAAAPVAAPMPTPAFDLVATAGIAETDEQTEPSAPPFCETWMRVPAAEAAERFLDFAYADVRPTAPPVRLPVAGDVPVTSVFVRAIQEFAPSPEPEPVAASVFASLSSRPAAYLRPPAQLRFSLHAIDDLSARGPATAQAPRPAGPVDAPPPMAVESMPSVPAIAIRELPIETKSILPTVRCLTAQVLPQARVVVGPSPEPVEVIPTAGRIRIHALPMRPALRGPSFARFQPAADPGEPLAAPAAAPPPVPVESMPKVAAFAARPQPAAPPILARAFHVDLRAELPIPIVPLPAPQPVAPPMAARGAALLEPLARINAQPAGAQPERPRPAVPCPGLIPLEYYSQRIASAPVKNIEALEPKIELRRQPWAVRPALNRLGEPKKRVVLPFEQLFAKPGDGKRVNITIAGKIAATVMVGLALWTGSRVANLSKHTEQLRAEVAASERTVTVADADPEAVYGKGPVGKLRRAIADRAAMEITDTFKSGMAAWGAQPKTLAAGWKKHSEGYVSVGEMALFQPSLRYTDYRMEFYGQIESKSMNWVVRAQDSKNYYAMRFKVIESGLRPIIAMVHYGVVNGKPGHTVETPLNVMIHNNQPYHVAVDVRGNHFSAAIEGETVEQWTEDTLPRGGVGFFAEAGEKARLYWMRLSRNQDWLGRVCAYMSGDGRSRQQTAEVWGPGFPHQKPEPVAPRGADLAAASATLDDNSPGRAKTAKQRRREGWIS